MTKFGLSIVVILLIIIAALGWFVVRQQQNVPATAPTTTVTTVTQPATIANDKTYTNAKLSFSIMYPSVAVDSPVDFSGYLPLTQTPLASFTLPKSMFNGTNLSEAGVYVGASSSPQAITSCSTGTPVAGETAAGTATINGADFYVFTSSDAGAGNFYDSKIYRRLENGWCVEVIELLHSTNIGNYTPGTIKEFDKAYFQKTLESIVHTYQSIPTGV